MRPFIGVLSIITILILFGAYAMHLDSVKQCGVTKVVESIEGVHHRTVYATFTDGTTGKLDQPRNLVVGKPFCVEVSYGE